MEIPMGARRNEDIALDLMKLIASTAQVGKSSSSTPGFAGSSSPKGEDQVTALLELYAKCKAAVEGSAK